MQNILNRAKTAPWIWAYLAAFLAWGIAMIASSGLGGGYLLSAALTFSVFSVFVGLGQMFVISSGPGNIDLSIPSVIAMGGLVAMKIMDGSNAMIIPGLLAALACGALLGLCNSLLIRILRVPPIIATLSMSLIVQSMAISYGRGLLVTPPPLLSHLVVVRFAGIPLLAVIGVIIAIIMGFVLHKTVYGRAILAVGQNENAARLAGVSVWRTRYITYALSGLFAALCGVLLSAISGGASLDMGNEYMLTSIALVVIGGTSIAGGKANVTGIWGAALFLYLLVSMLNSTGVSSGWRLVLNGLIIIAVIVTAGGDDK